VVSEAVVIRLRRPAGLGAQPAYFVLTVAMFADEIAAGEAGRAVALRNDG
jgi:hypothetical protein